VFAAVFGAAGQTYQIPRHCLQHFNKYFHFFSFLFILNGLLHEIFSALPATSEENREQTINLSDDWQGSKRGKQERIEGEALGESILETYSPSQ
jgi:hypothetical protein